jgi:hypothetical protein
VYWVILLFPGRALLLLHPASSGLTTVKSWMMMEAEM